MEMAGSIVCNRLPGMNLPSACKSTRAWMYVFFEEEMKAIKACVIFLPSEGFGTCTKKVIRARHTTSTTLYGTFRCGLSAIAVPVTMGIAKRSRCVRGGHQQAIGAKGYSLLKGVRHGRVTRVQFAWRNSLSRRSACTCHHGVFLCDLGLRGNKVPRHVNRRRTAGFLGCEARFSV